MTGEGFLKRKELKFKETPEGEAELYKTRQEGRVVKCIVVRDHLSKNVFGHVIPCKGPDEEGYVKGLIVEDITWLGHVKLILKSDQEVSLVALVKQAMAALRVSVEDIKLISDEHSQTYDSQASGGTEVGIRALRGLLRSLRICLEGRIGQAIPVQHPLMSWLLEHTTLLLNTCVRGDDGLTPWARVRGRAFGQRLIGFGECILWKPPLKGPQHDQQGNMGPRNMLGVFIGYSRTANSYKIWLPSTGEVVDSRSVQRLPLQDRWDAEKLKAITSMPWSLRTRTAPSVEFGEPVEKDPKPKDDAPPVARRLKITKETLRKYGFTQGCRQCEHIKAFSEAKAGLPHGEVCRARIVEDMKKDDQGAARVRDTQERIDRSIAERIRLDDERRAARPFEQPEVPKSGFNDSKAAAARGEGQAGRAHDEPVPPAISKDVPESRDQVDADGGPMVEVAASSSWEAPRRVPVPERSPAMEDAMKDIPVTVRAADIPRTPATRNDMDVDALDDAEFIMHIGNLGGDVKSYRREQRAAARKVVSEIYSPPRVTKAIASMPELGLTAGFALDLTCTDPEDGEPWDFDRKSKRDKALRKVREEKPIVLIGSPVCTPWCSWQRINNEHRDPADVHRDMVRARIHLDFVTSLYREQIENNRFFLHEHPQASASWNEKCIKEILDIPGVGRVDGDQCQYGAEVQFGARKGEPVRKTTGFMSNGERILDALKKRCVSRDGNCTRARGGRHATCSGRIAADAARYSPELCKAILRGISNQLHQRGVLRRNEVGLHAVDDEAVAEDHLRGPQQGYSGKYRDDISGQVLREDLVREARLKELDYFNTKGVWRKRSRTEAFKRTWTSTHIRQMG